MPDLGVWKAETWRAKRWGPHFSARDFSALFLPGSASAPFAGPTVVVTHHAPSIRSIDPLFQGDPVSAAYASNLESLMGRERVVLWVHGHTHRSTHYEVKGTQVVSNQRGYPEQRHTGFNPGLVVEV